MLELGHAQVDGQKDVSAYDEDNLADSSNCESFTTKD